MTLRQIVDELHGAIMNIRARDFSSSDYKTGHRDARHAAAELVLTHLETAIAQDGEAVAWKPVTGYEGLYSISNAGDLRSERSGKVQAKCKAGMGYIKADLWKDGKRLQTTIHRLVASHFLEVTAKEVNHKNGDKTDNRVENLEWVSASENVYHACYTLQHNIRPCVSIDAQTGHRTAYASVDLAVKDGHHSGSIYRCLNAPHKTHRGKHWAYADKAARPAAPTPDGGTK